MNKKGTGKFFMIMFGVMALSLIIAFSWTSIPSVKNSVNLILNPTAGALLNWNLTWGMMILVFIISITTTLVQKFLTDQNAIKSLKNEQREIQKEIKNFKHDPNKMMELQQKSLPLTFKIMELGMKATIFTIIPFILLFRWFLDFFNSAGNPKFFGFLSWFWFYLIFVMIFSTILRKILKVE